MLNKEYTGEELRAWRERLGLSEAWMLDWTRDNLAECDCIEDHPVESDLRDLYTPGSPNARLRRKYAHTLKCLATEALVDGEFKHPEDIIASFIEGYYVVFQQGKGAVTTLSKDGKFTQPVSDASPELLEHLAKFSRHLKAKHTASNKKLLEEKLKAVEAKYEELIRKEEALDAERLAVYQEALNLRKELESA